MKDNKKNNEVIRKITGCSDCPMCNMNDMSSGYSCRLKNYPDNYIEESKSFQPVTPDWCPVKENNVILRYNG